LHGSDRTAPNDRDQQREQAHLSRARRRVLSAIQLPRTPCDRRRFLLLRRLPLDRASDTAWRGEPVAPLPSLPGDERMPYQRIPWEKSFLVELCLVIAHTNGVRQRKAFDQ